MTETLHIPGGLIAIEEEMGVVPRCGSCFEPLFVERRWQSICMAADQMVHDGDKKEEVLEVVMMHVSATLQHHMCRASIIEEEP